MTDQNSSFINVSKRTQPQTKGENMKGLIFLTTLLTIGVASAHIPVTESATIMDANLDGSNFAKNYRVKDDCDGGAFQKPRSTGLAIVKFNTSFENEIAGVKSKHAELSYSYMRKQGGGKFEVKTGKFTLNKLRKITELKKVDGNVADAETKVKYEAANIDVTGDLADDSKDGTYNVTIDEDGSIKISGKDCDQKVTLTPTTDVTP